MLAQSNLAEENKLTTPFLNHVHQIVIVDATNIAT